MLWLDEQKHSARTVSVRRSLVALWWIPAGEIPSVADAERRVDHLRAHGSTPYAFDFKHRFPAPDVAGAEIPILDDRLGCPA